MTTSTADGSIYPYSVKAGRRWGYVIDAPGSTGRRQVRKQGFTSRQAARDALDALRDELRADRVPVPAEGSVRAFSEAWLAALPAEGLERSTVRYYREAISRLLPTIGDIPLQSLTALDLDTAYAAVRAGGRTARTVRASHSAARKMLDEALRLRLVGANVSAKARPPRAKAAQPKRFPTYDILALGRYLDALADDHDLPLWWTAAYTGMRRGELLALRWADVDLGRGVVTVARAVGEGDGKAVYEKAPKSGAGARQVELDDETVEVLRGHRKAQLELRMKLGAGWRDNGLVFCGLDGSPMVPNRVTERWRALAKKTAPAVGLPTIRLHDLRHSHATQLLAAAVRPDVVTERLGHSSVAFTLSQYAHVYEGDQKAAMNQLMARRRDLAGAAVDAPVTGP